jgi:hypothetical protein
MQKEAAPSLAGNERPVVIELQKNNNTTSGYFARYSSELLDNGWHVIPIKPGMKLPAISRWSAYSYRKPKASQVERWNNSRGDHSIGIVCGNVVAIDVDILDPALADRVGSLIRAILGPTPLSRVGQHPKEAYIYRVKGRIGTQRLLLQAGGGLDILGDGSQFVAYGIHPKTQRPYQWGEAEPIDTPVDGLPEVTAEDVERLLAALPSVAPVVRSHAPAGGVPRPTAQKPKGGSNCEIIRDEDTGLVIDGREKHLRDIVLRICRTSTGKTVRQLEDAIWSDFNSTTDTTRPKDGNGRPYSMADVRPKVGATLRKIAQGGIKKAERSRWKRPPKQAPAVTPEGVDAFCKLLAAAVDADRSRSHEDKLTAAAGTVGAFMLDRLQDGQFSDTASYIANGTGLAEVTVKKARRALAVAGLFDRAGQGGRDQSAPYWPNTRKVAQALDTYGVSGGGVYLNIPNTNREIPLQSGNDNDEAPLERSPLVDGHPEEGAAIVAPLNSGMEASNAADIVIKEHLENLGVFEKAGPAQMTFMGTLDEKTPELEAMADILSFEGGIASQGVIRVIRDTRRRRGQRQEDMARYIGISRPQLANWESGRFGLGRDAAERLRRWMQAR